MELLSGHFHPGFSRNPLLPKIFTSLLQSMYFRLLAVCDLYGKVVIDIVVW